jgi:hypothetical protein
MSVTIDDLPNTLFLLRRNDPNATNQGSPDQKLSLVFGETNRGELVLFLWSTLPAAISWRLDVKMDAQIIETSREQLIPMVQDKLPGCLLYYNAQPGELTFNTKSDRMIQLPI